MMYSSNDSSNNARIVELSNSPLSVAVGDNSSNGISNSNNSNSPKPIITTPTSTTLPFVPSPSLSDFEPTTVLNPVFSLSNMLGTVTPEQQQQQHLQQQLYQIQQLQQQHQQGQHLQLLQQQYQQLQNTGATLDANAAMSALNSLTSVNNPAPPTSSVALQPASTMVTQAVGTVARPAAATQTKAAKARSGTVATTSANDSTSTSQSLQPLTRATNNSNRGNVTNFLSKLYNMVGNPASNDLIHWSDDGDSFIVTDQVRFAKEVLPKFFKHNLFTSFVRQLNMYDFHKVPHLQQGVLMPDSDSEHCEFNNPHFQRDQPDLLHLVERKKASSAASGTKAGQDSLMSTFTEGAGNGVGFDGYSTGGHGAGVNKRDAVALDLGHIVKEVNAIKRHQVAISTDLRNIERDHQSLWQESISARERHQRQQETIDKILRFLASVFSGEKKRAIVPNKKARLTITDSETALRDSGTTNGRRLVEAESDDEEDLDEDDGAEDIVQSGSKRKRSQVDEANDGQQSSFNISELTPDTLAMLTNAKQKQQKKPTAATTTAATTTTATSTGGLPTIPTLSSAANTLTSTSTIPDYLLPSLLNYAQQNANKANTSSNDIKSTLGGGLQFDPSNLSLPNTLHPNILNSTEHHNTLRSITIANARDTTQSAQSLAPPLPPPNSSLSSSAALLSAPMFSQTTAGAHITRGVDQIVMDQERLQQSLDALGQHGLNIDNFDLDDDFDGGGGGGGGDDYLALAEHFDPYPAMYQDAMKGFSGFDQSHDTTHQFNQLQNFMSSHHVSFPGTSSATATAASTTTATTSSSSSSAVPAWSNNTNTNSNIGFHVGANPRITTVGEDAGLEELLDLGPS
ncbi:stress-responsive transcription factor hsf1 [Mortierella sp. AD032]|nr:stress-responsive transcription factor hsf1 [Mortierella sp. AD032]